ncbi:hypothetical protein [Propioniciclava sp.]|uniref:hypothetical protein n=1 Tax=Propioniciclava sp. TaxID=2038686 RepID=UPI002627CB7D|nr:hypothetical protein [Propioniciclava sp.]
MGPYAADVALLRGRARRPGDVVRPGACVARIRALREAIRLQLGLVLPEAYAAFLAECNGFSIAGLHLLGVDADLADDSSPLAARGFAGCLRVNLAREQARMTTRCPSRFLVVAEARDHMWGMKEEGSFWRVELHTLRELERFPDGATLMHTLAREAAG